jgi:hypothetical protein
MLLAYSVRVGLFSRLNRVVNKSKFCATACNRASNAGRKELSTSLIFPTACSLRVLRTTEAKDISI